MPITEDSHQQHQNLLQIVHANTTMRDKCAGEIEGYAWGISRLKTKVKRHRQSLSRWDTHELALSSLVRQCATLVRQTAPTAHRTAPPLRCPPRNPADRNCGLHARSGSQYTLLEAVTSVQSENDRRIAVHRASSRVLRRNRTVQAQETDFTYCINVFSS
jgi:hypothetical protein